MALPPNKISLYSTRSQGIILPVKGYDILVLSENAETASQRIKTFPMINRVKFAFAPKILRVFNKVLKTDFKELEINYGQGINVRYNVNTLKEFSCFFDITPYFAYLHSRLSPIRYAQIGLGFLNKIVKEVIPTNKPKILIYYLDDQILPTKIKEQDLYSYMFSYAMRKNIFDLGVEKVFLMSSNTDVVRCVYDRSKLEANKLSIYLMFVKKALSKVVVVTDEEDAQESIEKADDINIATDIDTALNPVDKSITPLEIKNITRSIARSAYSASTGIDMSLKSIKDRLHAFLLSSKDVTKVADVVVSKKSTAANAQVLNAAFSTAQSPVGKIVISEPNSSPEIHEELENDPSLDKLESIDDLNTETVCADVVNNNFSHSIKRRMNYHKKTSDLIESSIETPLSEIGYKLESVQFKIAKRDDLEIYETDIEYVIIKCKDPEGKTHVMRFMTPYLKENRYWESGGHRWYYPTIMSTFPIFIIKKHKVQFKTNYTAMTFLYAKINKREDIRVYVGGFKIPIVLMLMCILSLEGMLKQFGFGYLVSDKRMRDTSVINFPLKSGKFLIVQRKSDPISRCLLNGLVYIAKNFQFENISSSAEAYVCLKTITGKNKAEYIFKQIFKYIVDTQTAHVLKARGYPTTLLEIVKICMNLVTENIYEDKLDLNNVYLRTTDILVAGVEKGIHSAISLYKQKHPYQPKSQLTVDSTFVIKFFREQGVLQGLQQQNPTEEVSEYTSVRIVGPGGIPNSDAVQSQDRALRASYFGNIDPVDTSEGNPGERLYTTSGGFYDDDQKQFMMMEPNKDNTFVFGSSSSLTPFGDKNDNARMQMAANQRRQAVPLVNSESPMVCSGYESVIPSLTSSIFTKRALQDGGVLYVDQTVIILQNNSDGSKYSVDIRPAELPSGSGFSSAITYTPTVKAGDRVKQGQLLCKNQFIKPTLTQGINAKCAYLAYMGYNYEDGYIISESFAKKLTSVHYDYIEILLEGTDAVTIFPKIGQSFNEGEKIVQVSRSLIAGSNIEDLDEVIAPTNVQVVDISIYPCPGVNVEHILKDINNYYATTNTNLEKHGLDKIFDAAKLISNTGKYKEHGELLKKTKIVIKLVEYLQMSFGDKLCNRYAAKGVVTKILPDDMMPRTEEGLVMDVLINSMSVISRMNVAQLHELKLGNILWTATNSIRAFVAQGKPRTYIESYIIKLYDLLDATNNKTYSSNIAKQLKSYSDSQFKLVIDGIIKTGLKFIAASFKSPTVNMENAGASFVGAKMASRMIYPELGNIKSINPVSWGIMYMEKLEHMADIKINARSVGKTVVTTLEPTRGKARQGGQRFGEQDTWCLLAYDANKVLNDFWLVNGDNKDIKNDIISQIYNTGHAEIKDDVQRGGAGSLFDCVLIGMGLNPKQ